jgi:hypothetical protein
MVMQQRSALIRFAGTLVVGVGICLAAPPLAVILFSAIYGFVLTSCISMFKVTEWVVQPPDGVSISGHCLDSMAYRTLGVVYTEFVSLTTLDMLGRVLVALGVAIGAVFTISLPFILAHSIVTAGAVVAKPRSETDKKNK